MKKRYIIALALCLFFTSWNIKVSANSNGSQAPWETNNGAPLYQPTVNGNVIYYQIDCDKHYTKVWKTAVNDWNELGVLNLQPMPNNYNGVHIELTGQYDLKKAVYQLHHKVTMGEGITYFSSYSNGQMASADSNLTILASALRYKYLLRTAEHELGHALGFAHDRNIVNGRYVIMYDGVATNFKPLGIYEKQALESHYHTGGNN